MGHTVIFIRQSNYNNNNNTCSRHVEPYIATNLRSVNQLASLYLDQQHILKIIQRFQLICGKQDRIPEVFVWTTTKCVGCTDFGSLTNVGDSNWKIFVLIYFSSANINKVIGRVHWPLILQGHPRKNIWEIYFSNCFFHNKRYASRTGRT